MKFAPVRPVSYIAFALPLYKGRKNEMKEKRIRRGDIYMARIPKDAVGSVQAGVRPVLIIQNDQKNRTSPTVVVLAITSKIKRLDLYEHVLLPKMKRLPLQSMVMAEQQFTLDKSSLLSYRGHLGYQEMIRIDKAVRYVVFGRCLMRKIDNRNRKLRSERRRRRRKRKNKK